MRRDDNKEVSHAGVTDLPGSIHSLSAAWRGGGRDGRTWPPFQEEWLRPKGDILGWEVLFGDLCSCPEWALAS